MPIRPDTPFVAGFLPDTASSINRVEVQSDVNPRAFYVVSQNRETREWSCTCPIFRKTEEPCKHMTRVFDAIRLV